MSYKVAIRNNETGEVRIHNDTLNWDDEACEYMWTDGNYGCDCNRHLFFERSAGREPDEDRPCGDSKYSALYAELPDGRRITIDPP
jgi:hypothetical protein